jgi:hypothetical protein
VGIPSSTWGRSSDRRGTEGPGHGPVRRSGQGPGGSDATQPVHWFSRIHGARGARGLSSQREGRTGTALRQPRVAFPRGLRVWWRTPQKKKGSSLFLGHGIPGAGIDIGSVDEVVSAGSPAPWRRPCRGGNVRHGFAARAAARFSPSTAGITFCALRSRRAYGTARWRAWFPLENPL